MFNERFLHKCSHSKKFDDDTDFFKIISKIYASENKRSVGLISKNIYNTLNYYSKYCK